MPCANAAVNASVSKKYASDFMSLAHCSSQVGCGGQPFCSQGRAECTNGQCLWVMPDAAVAPTAR
jgi:hypothetical protein